MDDPGRESEKCELAADLLRAGSTLRLRVTGSSMLPTLWPRDIVVIEPAELGSVCRGDIVLVARDDRFFIHRLRSIDAARKLVITRGDCMPGDDPPAGAGQLLGRITTVLRCHRVLLPAPLSTPRSLCARLLSHSRRCQGAALRWRQWRSRTRRANGFRVASGDLPGL